MNTQLYGLLLLFTSLMAPQLSASSVNQANQKTQSLSILVFGDSLSAAYNLKREQGWVNLLQDQLKQKKHNIKVINASISGETTSGGLERLEKQLKLYQPAIIILELGGNDGLRGFDLVTTRNNLNQMITISLNYSAKVLLAGIKIPPNYGRTYTRRFEAIYNDLAQKENVELIPFILDKVATHNEYMQQDGIHPNAKGQPLIMQTVWKYLQPLIQ